MSELIPKGDVQAESGDVQIETLPERVGKRILPALLILAGSGGVIGFLIVKALIRLR